MLCENILCNYAGLTHHGTHHPWHQVVYDLPAGGKRLVQRAQGYRHTFVSEKETVRDDEHTGELPGKLLR